MKNLIRFLFAGALVAAFGVAVLMANPWADAPAGAADVEAQQDSPAAALLRQALETYAGRTEYAGTFRITQSMTAGGQTGEASAELDYALRLPGMLYARLQTGGMALTVACDGQTFRAYFPETGKYLDLPAPEDVRQVLDLGLLGPVAMPRVRAMTFGLFEPNALAPLLAGADEPKLSDPEVLDGRDVRRVVARTDEDTLTLWIAQDQPQVLKAELDMWQTVEDLKEQQPDLESVRFTVVIDPPAADASIPEAAFVLAVPEDARLAADMEDLFKMDMTGKPMVDFELPGLEADSTWRLSDLKGNVIALDFWATWCGPCRMEMPLLQDIYGDLKGEGFALLGVNQGEGPEEIEGFFEELKLDIPVAMDTDGSVAGAYSVNGLPTLVLIGRDGIIQAVHRGYAPGLERLIRQEVETLLAGKSLLAE